MKILEKSAGKTHQVSDIGEFSQIGHTVLPVDQLLHALAHPHRRCVDRVVPVKNNSFEISEDSCENFGQVPENVATGGGRRPWPGCSLT